MALHRKGLNVRQSNVRIKDRGGRSSRLGMFAKLFVLVWAPLYALFQFLGLLGFVVGAGTIFVGVLGGVGLLVATGWLLVNFVQDGLNSHDRNYRAWRRSGGDPYFDWTWFWPLNTDTDEVRLGGEWIICPNPSCGETFPKRLRNCPRCRIDNMDFLRCGNCGTSIFDPHRSYDEQSGIRCPGCGLISRSPMLADLPIIALAVPPDLPRV